jgi:hypothetical protein
MYDVSPRYRGRRFREHTQIGAAPTVNLERTRETVPTVNLPPPALYAARDRKLIGMLTGGGGGGQQGDEANGFPTKNRQKVSQNIVF